MDRFRQRGSACWVAWQLRRGLRSAAHVTIPSSVRRGGLCHQPELSAKAPEDIRRALRQLTAPPGGAAEQEAVSPRERSIKQWPLGAPGRRPMAMPALLADLTK